jgi:hypothetical protein
MSEILKDLQTAEEISADVILNELLNKAKKKFHTEIHNPLSISTLDTLTKMLADYKCDDILKIWLSWFRTNMVAYRRKRAEEIVRGVQALRGGEEETTSSLKRLLLGRS